MMSILLRTGCFALILLTVITGCGGGGRSSSLLNMSGSGYLGNSEDTVNVDGAYMDQIGFTATRNGRITVTMSSLGSDTVDPMVYVVKNDGNYTFVASDDDSGEGLNAVCSFTAVAGQSYCAWFSTSYRYDSGYYSFTIAEVDPTLAGSGGDSTRSDVTKSITGSKNSYEKLKQKIGL